MSVIQTRRVWERVLVQIGDEATVETDLYAALVAIRSALEPYRSG